VLVTFDASIYISAMEYGGVPKEAIVLALLVDTIITCDQLEDELFASCATNFFILLK